MRLPTILVLGLCLLALPAAQAVTVRHVGPEGPDPRERRAERPSSRMQRVLPGEPGKAGLSAGAFVERHGGEWSFRIDPRTERFTMIQGSGIPLWPGRGNQLSPAAGATAELSLTGTVEPAIRAFVDKHGPWLVPASGELVFDPIASAVREGGRLASVYYTWHVDGVPVEGSRVYVRVNSGNVTQIGSRWVGPFDAPTTPAIKPREALRRLLAYSGDEETARASSEPELLLQPEEGVGSIEYRLVWRMGYTIHGRIESWEGRVDARTGEVVQFVDTNYYARAVAGVHRVSPFTPEETVPLAQLDVLADGVFQLSDAAGAYPYVGGTTSATMNGRYFDVECDTCTNPAAPFVEKSTGNGRIDFGLGGIDEVGNGLSTPAGRTSFYHLNRARRLGLAWLPGEPYLETQGFISNVNIPSVCNAVYNGAVNFFRSGGGCNNTGEIADVINHEWGHGLDLNTQGGDAGTGEGTADVVAMHLSRSPLLGPGFRVDGSAVRDLDATTSPTGLLTATRIANGDCDFMGSPESHCVGELYGQIAWELAQALAAKHGTHTGWRTSERIFFTSLNDAGSWNPESGMPIYDAYLMADDDDGNLANGTPNGAEIHAAFEAHEAATSVTGSSPACNRPDQPTVDVESQCGALVVSWNEVDGAAGYEVLRKEWVEDSPYFPVASLAAGETMFADPVVAPDHAYWYAVMAIDDGGCESTVDAPLAAGLIDQPVLEITAVAIDDTPRGNRSGFADPGEEVDLVLTLTNHGASSGAALAGTLETDSAFVEILEGATVFADLSGGASGFNETALRFRTDPATACGAEALFRFTPDDSTGCAAEVSYFAVRLGQAVDGGFVCDDTPACFVEPTFAGALAALPGASCAETRVGWDPASSNCTNATIDYNVYRGDDPGFTPDPTNLVAAGLTTNQFTDSLLDPGETYHYIVRANDSRSGEDSNLLRRQAIAPTTPDLQPPVFPGLVSAGTGGECGETLLVWDAALETCSGPVIYDVFRSADPGFVPGPEHRIASTFDTTFVDASLPPEVAMTYVVRARDDIGNSAPNTVRGTTQPFARDLIVAHTDFEPDDGGWTVIEPDDAATGNWQWGDPVGTNYQPEDDVTPDGIKCWITGIAPTPSNGDIDSGTTTLLSARYDTSAVANPAVRYHRWFTNDAGNAPGEFSDRFQIDVSGDDGSSWTPIEVVGAGTPLAWVPVEIPLSGLAASTDELRVRFQAADLGAGSLVEAGIDEFSIVDLGGGCAGCDAPVSPVDTIIVDRSGDDVILDWSTDPAPGVRFVVYSLDGAAFELPTAVGSTDSRSFVHAGAVGSAQSFFYRVVPVDACGNQPAP